MCYHFFFKYPLCNSEKLINFVRIAEEICGEKTSDLILRGGRERRDRCERVMRYGIVKCKYQQSGDVA